VARTRRCPDSSGAMWSLRKIAVTCFSTVAWLSRRVSAIPRFDLPSGERREDSVITGRQDMERVAAGPATEHPAHDLGVQRTAAGRDPVHRVHEHGDVTDPLLEQVADAFGVLADERQGVRRFAELRQDEDTGLRTPATQLDGGPEAVVLTAGRHPHVDDRDVGPVGEGTEQQVLGVAGLRH
jgi:hypothetical protein